jgi:dolichyl-phosphate-mannose-protein mannosyltransferase
MTSAGQTGDAVPLKMSVGTLKWLALGFIAIKAFMMATTPVFMDEAYYWVWAQRPGLSFYDHPPLSAWFLGLFSPFDGSVLALRAPVVLTFFGDIWVIHLFSRFAAPAHRARYFWLTVLLFAATPIFSIMATFASPDHVLIFFLLLGLYCFARFLREWQPKNQRGYRWLFAAGLCVGLATLAKYNGVLLGVGFALFLVVSREHRVLLAKWQTWATGALALLVMTPVLVWNIQNGLASFEFIASVRHAGLPGGFFLEGFIGYVGSILLVMSPFLIPASIRFLRSPPGLTFGPGYASLSRVVVLVSTGAIAAVSLFTTILFHWNMVAFVGVLPFLAFVLASRAALLAHLVYSLVFLALIYTNFALVPFAILFKERDWSSEWSFGWKTVAERVIAAQNETGATLVGAPNFRPASQLAFALKNPDVLRFGDGIDQYSFWADGTLGEDAIIVADRWNRVDTQIRGRFDSVTLLEKVPVVRFGVTINVQLIYLGRGYRGRP